MAWLLYGANGYTGSLLARAAVKCGQQPILAGRNRAEVERLAAELNLPLRVFPLDGGIDLSGVDVVMHTAGPFARTAAQMRTACLQGGVSYLDVTGEIDVLEDTLSLSDSAKQKGVVLMSGCGFDVVPSDLLANRIAKKIASPTKLEIAFATKGGISPGTLKTMIEKIPFGNKVRRGGKIVTVPFGQLHREITMGGRTRSGLSIPWGDVASAYRSTGIPNITIYLIVPSMSVKLAPLLGHRTIAKFLQSPGRIRRLQSLAERYVKGPSESVRGKGKVFLWARVENEAGHSHEEELQTEEGYDFTVKACLHIIEQVQTKKIAPGAWTPAQVLNEQFLIRPRHC